MLLIEGVSFTFFFFFFQAEDGIRDVAVTGVQTCAVPATTVATRSVRMMSWGPGNGSPARNPVAPAMIARPNQAATVARAAPGRRGKEMGAVVMAILLAQGLGGPTLAYTTI